MPTVDQASSFDLITEPWIPVVGVDGSTSAVSLEQLVIDAHTIRRIAAEAPTMTAALHRLVIALVHRVYGPPKDALWGELWSGNQLPAEPLRTYLDRYRERFDLFHPTLPFMQCAALGGLTPATPGKLVPYRAVGNNVTLFDHTTSTDRLLLTPPEAARWLVTAHAFDPGGMKTPYAKDKSSERAPCNNFGVVVIEGRNLKETLLLNTLVYRPDDEKPYMTTRDDRPVWEDPNPPSPEPDKRVPRGWTDLLTWPSRRVLLLVDRTSGSTVVDGVVVTPGVRLDIVLPDEEKMSAFRRPKDTKGRPKLDAPILPIRLRPVRGIWRHSVELLLSDSKEEGRTRQRPRALDQISELAERPSNLYFPANTVYTLRVFGQQLDSKASVVETWLEEEVPAPLALLRASDENLAALVGDAITLADETGSAIRALQANYRRELRAEPVADLDVAYWPRLSRPFGSFLVRLGDARVESDSEGPVADDWAQRVRGIALSVVDRWVAGSLADAKAMLVLGKYHGQFLSRLARAKATFDEDIGSYLSRKESSRG